MPKFPVDEWRVLLLRLTGFPAGEMPSADGRQWWQDVVGTAPETRVVKARSATVEESGPLPEPNSQAKLTVVSDPNRVDLKLTAQDVNVGSLAPDDIGILSSGLPVIAQLGRRWLTTGRAPALKRVALGAVLIHPVASAEEGLSLLAGFLPNVTIPVGASDLLYRINRRRQSKVVAEMQLNRLSTWSVGATTLVRMEPAANVSVTSSAPSCVLEFDVNTPADRTAPLLVGELPALLDEMAGLATEIAAEGDIP